MKHLIEESSKILEKINKAGVRYMLYPWGASPREVLPSFFEINKLSGALVGKAEIVQGIGKALGMEIPVLTEATGDVDTSLSEKLEATKNTMATHDFVVVHFNGSDEAAHSLNPAEKQDFI